MIGGNRKLSSAHYFGYDLSFHRNRTCDEVGIYLEGHLSRYTKQLNIVGRPARYDMIVNKLEKVRKFQYVQPGTV